LEESNLNSLQAITALAGVFLGSVFTLIGVWINNKENTKRLKLQFKHEEKIRQKTLEREYLEELYVISDKYFNTLISHFLPYRTVMKGELTFNEALDLNIDTKLNFDVQRVSMIIHMYFPKLENSYDEILKVREELNEIIFHYGEQYKNGNQDGSKWLLSFQPDLELISKKMQNFRDELRECLTKHSSQ